MENLWEGEDDDTTVADETCEELFTVCVWKTLGLLFWLFSSVISFWRLKVNAQYYNKLLPSFEKSRGLGGCCCTFFRLFSSNTYGDIDSFRIRQQNLWFHVFSLLGSVTEIPKYINYIVLESSDYNVKMYPLHLFSLFSLYISFCIIINLWGSAIVFEAKDSKRARLLRLCLILLTAIDFVLIAIVAVLCFFVTMQELADPADGDTQMYHNYYEAMVFYQTFGMSMLSVFFLIFGYAAQRKIWKTFSRSEGWQRGDNFWKGLLRLNAIIVICFICFTTKAVCSFLLTGKGNSKEQVSTNPLDCPTTAWILIYEWIPDILPRLALLYLMSRNLSEEENARHQLSNSGDNTHRRSEAFSDDHGAPVFMGRSFAADSIDQYTNFAPSFARLTSASTEEKKDVERANVSAEGFDDDEMKRKLLENYTQSI
ncbi:hypothetical protein TrLO_g4288 [Triparma laevis f. longispina]|uniref:THH1/TOM1/TOM3 domain-containing protein n=1 Tax=Triparma laevis f. longispina TaxID=1714387 RepID=A0A9W7DZS6_9STRA|nr:hypothetical protein TrLO_g4288 [Triparma laevis f. longispina]